MDLLCFLCTFASVHFYLVVTCWERADLLALVDVYCIFVTYPCGILGQVWYLIVSFPDLCRLSFIHGSYRQVCVKFKDFSRTSFKTYLLFSRTIKL